MRQPRGSDRAGGRDLADKLIERELHGGDGRLRLTRIVGHQRRRVYLEWLARDTDRERFEPTYILLGPEVPAWAEALDRYEVPFYHVRFDGHQDQSRAISQVSDLCRELRTDVVHSFYGGRLAGSIGALLAGVKVRVCTRHHGRVPQWVPQREIIASNLFHKASSHIVATDQLTRQLLLKEGVPDSKISIVNYGFDQTYYSDVPAEQILALRNRYVPAGAGPVIGVVSRATEWKGLQYIIPAFRQVLQTYPEALLLLVNPVGRYQDELRNLLQPLPPKNYALTGFEAEIAAIFKLFDVFVHAPIEPDCEAFGIVYLEALASGVPSVVTKAGIALEIMEHRSNAWVADYQDIAQIAEGIEAILADSALREKLIRGGLRCAAGFSIERMVREHELLYQRLHAEAWAAQPK